MPQSQVVTTLEYRPPNQPITMRIVPERYNEVPYLMLCLLYFLTK